MVEAIFNTPIGVFDSGLGGVSVLRQMRYLMPAEQFLYYGDCANAPYGTRTVEEVRDLTIKHVSRLLDQGCKAIVVACNTATSCAIKELREMYSDIPIVGIEPAIKPAVTEHPGGNILVMATPMTLKQQKFNKLMHKYEDQANIIPVPCPGLMEFIESGDFDGEEVYIYLHELFEGIKERPLDGIVLGCTHYPFVQGTILEMVGEHVDLYDGAIGTAKEMQRRLREIKLLATKEELGHVHFECSGNRGEKTKLFQRLMALPVVSAKPMTQDQFKDYFTID